MEILAIFITFILVLGILFLYFIHITTPRSKAGRGGGRVDLSVVPTKWAEVQAMMKAGTPANYKQSIMEADKLVDLVLGSKVPGETMGERLKNAKHLFSRETYDDLWTAHKIRNKVAHEPDFDGLGSDALLATRNFEKALRELRAL